MKRRTQLLFRYLTFALGPTIFYFTFPILPGAHQIIEVMAQFRSDDEFLPMVGSLGGPSLRLASLTPRRHFKSFNSSPSRSLPDFLHTLTTIALRDFGADYPQFFKRLDQLEDQDIFPYEIDEWTVLENAIFDREMIVGLAPEPENFGD